MMRSVAALYLWLLILGTNPLASVSSKGDLSPAEHRSSAAAQQDGSSDVSSQLRSIASAGQLAELRWPNFSDYRQHVRKFYEASNYSLAWIRDGQPTPQALMIVDLLKAADREGLDPEDYDGSSWGDRIAGLQGSKGTEEEETFDAALTVSLMRYISDRHIGKINPTHFKFGLSVGAKKYDLAAFVHEQLVNAPDVKTELAHIGPPFAAYRRTLEALQHYLQLAREDDGEPLPVTKKPFTAGDPYDGISRLTRLLRLLGDLPTDTAVPDDSNLYQGALVDAVKRFQSRHGLKPNGKLDEQTLANLNTPLSQRVAQLRLTLERWRWVPYRFTEPPIVVNIPEFRLRAFDGKGNAALTMNVIVGKAFRHKTPVFEKDMKYVVFRPYWNVPPSIQRSEIVPAVQKTAITLPRKGSR
jgi:murein L,D-transpeptidase YcbB/YkuD